ncbi:MAG TPA: RodZ domain-containing protein [Thermoanaerobaculaceae bacterium]|nr:RodZ domain-containing protein [Thermoanaerobaculaceae bacterium]
MTRTSPKEFGESLRSARLAAGATLEAIGDRTKISLRLLAALEAGEFAKLPNRAFAKMFLRQYLEIIGAPQSEWIDAFDAAWERSFGPERPTFSGSAAPVRGRHPGPWIVGLCLVAAGIAAVLWLERRSGEPRAAAAAPTPEALAPTPAQPTAPPAPPTPAATATATPAPGVLTIRTGAEASWVSARVDGGKSASRLMPAGSVWEIDAGGRDVDLVLGDAGAVSVTYLGENRSPAGRRGEVARLHLRGTARPAESGQ